MPNPDNLLLAFISGAGLSLFGWSLARIERQINRRNERLQAAAALRFELELNLAWLQDVPQSRNYLRDEAWCGMKNNGYISFLENPIPRYAIQAYSMLHQLNYELKLLKDGGERQRDVTRLQILKIDLQRSFDQLIQALDLNYPSVAKNFRVQASTVDKSKARAVGAT